MIINGFWYTYIHRITLMNFFSSFFFSLELGCVKIVNYYSHDPSIGRRKSFNHRILMVVQIVSRVIHAIISENAQRAIPRRKHWSGSDRWVMFRWPVKRQIRLLSQVNLHSFLILYLICAKLNCVLATQLKKKIIVDRKFSLFTSTYCFLIYWIQLNKKIA